MFFIIYVFEDLIFNKSCKKYSLKRNVSSTTYGTNCIGIVQPFNTCVAHPCMTTWYEIIYGSEVCSSDTTMHTIHASLFSMPPWTCGAFGESELSGTLLISKSWSCWSKCIMSSRLGRGNSGSTTLLGAAGSTSITLAQFHCLC